MIYDIFFFIITHEKNLKYINYYAIINLYKCLLDYKFSATNKKVLDYVYQ